MDNLFSDTFPFVYDPRKGPQSCFPKSQPLLMRADSSFEATGAYPGPALTPRPATAVVTLSDRRPLPAREPGGVRAARITP